MRRHALALGVAFVVIIVAFGDVAGASRGLFFRDHVLVFRPLLAAAARAIAAGRVPGLADGTWGGVPIEQSTNAAVYTPGTLLLLLPSFDVAYDWYVIFHFGVLAGGVYGFACSLGATRAQALLAASIGALSGPVLSLENLVVALVGCAYAPWTWWGLAAVLRDPRPRNVALLALAAGFHVQGIMPEVAVLDLGAAIALWLVIRPRAPLRVAAAVGGALVLALAIAAADLVPFAAAFRAGKRGHGFEYDALSGWALGPPIFIELIVPSFWNPPDVPFINPPSITGQLGDPFYLTSVYFGAALAVAAASLRARRAEVAIAVAVVILVVIAMGRHAPLHRLVAALPLFKSSRYAVKYMIPAAAAVAALAALGCRRLDGADDAKKLAVIAAVQAAVIGVLIWTVAQPEFRELLAEYLQGWGTGSRVKGVAEADFPEIALAAMRPRLLHACAAAALVSAAAGVAVWRPALLVYLPASTAVLVALDLATAARFTVFGVEVARQQAPREVQELLSGSPRRYFPATPGGELAEVAHEPGHTYFEDIMASHGQRARNVVPGARRWLDLDLDGQSNPMHLETFQAALVAREPINYRIMARAGVEHLTSWSASIGEQRVLTWPVRGEVPEHAYRLDDARPYVSAFVRWRPPRRPLLETFADASAWEVAIVREAARASTSTTCAPARVVSFRRPFAERVEAEVESACDALVVAQEPVVRGWTASVDGAAAELLTAEAGYLAAQVPAGKHEVRFEFHSLAAQWAPATLLGVVAALALILLDRRGRRPLSP